MKDKKVAVIGGGISGLCTAVKLKKAGVNVVLFESGERVGGIIKTVSRDGFRYEEGPNSTLASVELLDLISELGLADQIAIPSPNARKRYILKNGKLAALPAGVFDLVKSTVFSASAKFRLLREPFVGSRSPEDESVADFFERRLGRELVQYAVDPFISGIYAGDPQRLRIKYAFPRLYEMERDHGSLIKAAIFGKKDRSKKLPKGTPRSITFTAGMQTLSDALCERLKESIRPNTKVDSITGIESGGFFINSGGRDEPFDAVVISTPAHTAARLIEILDPGAGGVLSDIYYPPVSVVYTGFRKDQVTHSANGFGFLVPGDERRNILGSLWTSSVFEGRAPAGHHLFTTFLGGGRNAAVCEKFDEELIRIAVDELGSILEIKGKPVMTAIKRWKEAIPQYNMGYERVYDAISDLKERTSGLYLCSNYYKGISVSDCIRNAGVTAAEIVDLFSRGDQSK